jgi:hypothetical protein
MAGSAFGQSDGFNRTVQLGGAYMVMNQSYLSGGATENDVISGPGVQLVGTSGNPFGFLIAASFAWAQGATENGASVSLSPYDRRFIDDILLGFAYRQTLIPHLGVTLGAGAHALGAQIFSSASIGAYLDVAYVAGIEGVARVSYDFTKSVGLYLSATASYDPLALVDATTRSYQSGITYSAGAGIEILR